MTTTTTTGVERMKVYGSRLLYSGYSAAGYSSARPRRVQSGDSIDVGRSRRRVTAAAESPHANENKWVIIKMVEEEEEEEKECK